MKKKMMNNMDEKLVREIIRDELQNFLKNDKFVFEKLVQFLDGRNIQVGKTTGTEIGTEALQKIGFHGATPVVQASHIADPGGGATVDGPARTAISAILTVLQNKGFIATS